MAVKLKSGYTFYYKNKLWKVTEVYKIKWNDGTKSEEYKVKTKSGRFHYLEIETNKQGKKTFSFWTKHSDKNFLRNSQQLVKDFVPLGTAKFPKNLNYKGTDYIFDERNDGVCNYGYESEKVNSLDYTNENDTKFLAIELWDNEIEVSTGVLIKQPDISKVEKGISSTSNSGIINFISKNAVAVIIFSFFCFSFLLRQCSAKKSWNTNSNYNSSDSTKVYRNNNYYRGRSGGFGK